MRGNIIGCLAIERPFPCQQLIQHDSKGVDIRPLVDHIALQLFWRHVFGCSPGLLRDNARSASHLTCETEVSKLRLAVGVEKDVSGLHITMDQAMTVRGLQSIGYLKRQADRLRERQLALAFQAVFERFMQQGHDQIEAALTLKSLLASMVDGHDVRVTEGRNSPGFLAEAIDVIRILGKPRGENLHRNVSPQRRIVCPIDIGHASLANQLAQVILAQTLSGQTISLPHRAGCLLIRSGVCDILALGWRWLAVFHTASPSDQCRSGAQSSCLACRALP